LKAEREHRGLSVPQVAEDLHVGVATIEALEAGRFASLGAPVYAKGHLRKYARLLGLDAEALLAACETTQPPTPELVPLKQATRTDGPRVTRKITTIAVVAILAGCVGWLLANREWLRSVSQTLLARSTTASPAGDQPSTTPDTATVPATLAALKHEATAPAPQTETATPATLRIEEPVAAQDGARVRVRMSFAADSWVEVYDATEQRVFFDMGTTGTARIVAADAPLRVFLGFADGVRLELDGRAIALPSEVRRGNLAEFFLDAHGNVRPKR